MPYEFAPYDHADIGPDIVFAIATDVARQRSLVKLEASRKYVEEVWGLNWKDQAAVLSRFEAERDRYLAECEKAALDDSDGVGVFRIA
jgi:hypothetical protein